MLKKIFYILFTLYLLCSCNIFKKDEINLVPYKVNIDYSKYTNTFNKNDELINLEYEKIIKHNYFSDDILKKMFIKPEMLSKEEAKEDIELLLYLLKTRYVEYNNIDFKNLEKEKDIILKDVDNKISLTDFKKKILNLLNKYINNSHFIFEENKISKKSSSYIYNKYIKKNNGKYFINNKEIYKINDEEDIEKFIVKTLDENFNLQYTIVDIDFIGSLSKNIKIEYTDNSYEEIEILKINGKMSNQFQLKVEKDYIYLSLPTFLNINLNGKNLEEYLFYKLKDEKVENKNLIIDLRGNSGGYISSIEYILRRYYDLPFNVINLVGNKYNNITSYLSWYYDNYKKGVEKFVKKRGKSKIFIIVNNKSASSSEVTISILKLLDYKNVYVLGSNSSGTFITTSGDNYILKNSNLILKIPRSGNFVPKEYHGEGIGFYPDVWIKDGKDIENVVKELIKKID
ncbi:S41 family peptidase [Streptobacillus moniliformis]|uniref:S41 family peptidase n=1 Tax=Streptobacillus moniliformis TaxID=34105 RepID=UPI0007E44107|nr:S41 family peptidase [Streptobacillus moniliformis]